VTLPTPTTPDLRDEADIRPHAGPQEAFLSNPADICIGGGSAGGGKLLEVSTPLPTPTGWRAIGDICPGEAVYGRDGHAYTVTQVSRRIVDEAWRLTFDDGSQIVAHDEHLWLTFTAAELHQLTTRTPQWRARRRARRNRSGKRGHGNPPFPPPTGTVRDTRTLVATLRVRDGRRANHAIPVAAPLRLPEHVLPLDPYLLGVWLGDGNTSGGAITSADPEVFDAFRAAGWVVSQPWANSAKCGRAEMRNIVGLTAVLKRMGLFGHKHIPTAYLWASIAQREALLQGLMDTDGGNDGSGVSFCSTVYALAEGVRHLAVSLGHKVTLRSKRMSLNGQDVGECWTLKFVPNRPLFRIPRKRDAQKIATRRTTQFRYIVSAERVPEAEMCCIAIDAPDHLYLASEAMIPTHNTFSLLMEPLRHIAVPDFDAVLFRRTFSQLEAAGGPWAESEKIYPYTGATSAYMKWKWDSGATIRFSHLQHEKNRLDWKGAQIALILFDQLEDFTARQFWYLLSRNRSVCGVRPYTRATCMAGDTLVVTATGGVRRLDQCRRQDRILSLQPTDASAVTQQPVDTITRMIDVGYRIRTNQSEILCSPDHRVFRWTPTGVAEVRADALRVGDYLATPRTLPMGPRQFDPDEAYLVGYTAGDGGITGRHRARLCWSEADGPHAAYIAEVARRVCRTKIGCHQRRTSKGIAVYTTAPNDYVSQLMSRWRDALVPQPARAVPWEYTEGDAEATRAVVQGLFDAEGYVGRDAIEFAVTSRELAHQVIVFLRRFGIIARLRVQHRAPPRHPVFTVMLCGQQAIRYAECIGFRMVRKQAVLDMALPRWTQRLTWARNREVDGVPIDRHALWHLRDLVGKSWWNRNAVMRRGTAMRLFDLAQADGRPTGPLSTWIAWAWQRVTDISETGPMPVYDLVLPDVHTYVAGGVLSHNCNPVPVDDETGGWLHELLQWWIDPESGYPIPERAGKLRWFLRRSEQLFWGDTRDEVLAQFPGTEPALVKSLSFVPMAIEDNPTLLAKDPQYLGTLESLPYVERMRLRKGNWNVRESTGSLFQRIWFLVIPTVLAGQPVARTRFWDCAATAAGGDFTVGVRMARYADGMFVIEDMIRGQWAPGDVEKIIVHTAQTDGYGVRIREEQESGSSGKSVIAQHAKSLVGFDFRGVATTGDKVSRWKPLAAQAQVGHVSIVMAAWNREFLDEMGHVPDSPYDDIADATAGAFNDLTRHGPARMQKLSGF
jgi:predicted phage terminase large subunit-like protein